LISCSKFKGFLGTHKDDKQNIETNALNLIKSGTMSEKVYFIINGSVHIMDESGMLKYGTLSDGSCFGEISLLLSTPN
jgi:CRP-like cAMP-binding protein